MVIFYIIFVPIKGDYKMTKNKTKCNFCKYWSGSSCMVTPFSAYCKEASDEFYNYLKNNKTSTPVKSLRSWETR